LKELCREDVLDARRLSPEEKFLAGPRLFDLACEFTKAGIRNQHPEAENFRRSLPKI